jgi:hypothetical protein
MRRLLSLIACALAAGCSASREPVPTASVAESAAPRAARIDFATVVRPILEAKCAPCHFEGGVMHDRLPFDQPETIRLLGTRLFTRIQDEVDQAVINAFLAQPADETAPSGAP